MKSEFGTWQPGKTESWVHRRVNDFTDMFVGIFQCKHPSFTGTYFDRALLTDVGRKHCHLRVEGLNTAHMGSGNRAMSKCSCGASGKCQVSCDSR